ncbi:hypothetical protein BDF14DRAFT_1745573 [Spinellus fusiger]|nr:hypothetical protein BDF14DRAFT_1745573 [Spinellus fusiger]
MPCSSQSEQPAATTSSTTAAGAKRKSINSVNTHVKKRPALDTTRPAATTRSLMTPPSSLKTPPIQPRKQNPIMPRSSQPMQPTTTTTIPPMTPPSSLGTPRIQPRKQAPIMPRSFKPEQPATTISDTVAAKTKNISSKSLDTNVKKRCVLDTKLNNLQKPIEADNSKSFMFFLEGDVLDKDVQASKVAEGENDLEREEQESPKKTHTSYHTTQGEFEFLNA